MQSNSEPEKINIAENTHQYLKEIHHFNYRGRLEVKHEQLLKIDYGKEKISEIT